MRSTDGGEQWVTKPEETWPTVVPMPTYEDVAQASRWLCEAFGFDERQRFQDAGGTVTTAILSVPGGGVLLLGKTGPSR